LPFDAVWVDCDDVVPLLDEPLWELDEPDEPDEPFDELEFDAVVVEPPLDALLVPLPEPLPCELLPDVLAVVVVDPEEPLWLLDDPVEPPDVPELDAVVVELPVDVLLLPLVDPLLCALLPEVLAVVVAEDVPFPLPLPPALLLPVPVELLV